MTKACYIIQPGKIGDIIICLPIAKYYFDKGYKVFWFIHESLLQMFEYVDYVEPICVFNGDVTETDGKVDLVADMGMSVLGAYYKLKHSIDLKEEDKVIDLAIGFSGSKMNSIWSKNKTLSFDRWKYEKAEVPFEEKYNLQINRNYKKEEKLLLQVGVHIEDAYTVEHCVGTLGEYDFHRNIIQFLNEKREEDEFFCLRKFRVKVFKGFTVFDWLSIIENCDLLCCVDSCVANLVNQLGLCKGKRIFRPWTGLYSDIDIPEMAEDWEII